MRYLSLFSGIEAASTAWEPLGWEPMAFAEVDDFPAAVLAHRWPDVPNLGDVCKVDWKRFVEEHGRPDVLIGGSPCFPAGTVVECDSTYKPIEQVEVGDMVLTHKHRYKKVVRTMSRMANVTRLKGEFGRSIVCTSNHPILNEHWDWVPAAQMLGQKWFVVDHGVFEKVVSVDPVVGEMVRVYNLEVADDNSYTADGIAVHNCQSFSVAGGRESLDGKSRLMYEYIRACEEVRSPWILYENVPGVLNVRDGAFGQLLQELQRVGYVSLAWRVLDAQFVRVPERDDNGRITGWFGPVAQRRRRVFLVGHIGEGDGCAAAVLFESESVSGNTQASGKKREELTAAARECSQGNSEPIAFKWFMGAKARTMPMYTDGTIPTHSASDAHVSAVAVREIHDDIGSKAVAFAQNQRDELRLIGGDGEVASSINAQRWGNHKGETLICVSSPATNAEVCEDQSPTLLSRQYKDPPYVVIDRAAYNQGENAQYDPYIEPSEVMPPLVARGPHAVGYESAGVDAEQSQESIDESVPQSCEHESVIDFGEGG